jgi:uncharacterized protein (DUF1778 family)
MAANVATTELTNVEQAALKVAAAVQGVTVNRFIAEAIRAAMERVARTPHGASVRAMLNGEAG